MNFASVFLIALSLAMDAFAVSISNGISSKQCSLKDALITGLFFGGFQFFMPVLGWALGTSVSAYIEAIDHFIAFGLLGFIGANMIYGAVKEANEKGEACSNFNFKTLTLQAIATSIDALAVGISFAILKVNIISAALVIGIVAFLFSVLGVRLGRRLGNIFRKRAEILGGFVLIGIGLKILIEHLFFI